MEAFPEKLVYRKFSALQVKKTLKSKFNVHFSLSLYIIPGITLIMGFKPGLEIKEESISPADAMKGISCSKSLLSVAKGEIYYWPLVLFFFSSHIWPWKKVLMKMRNQEMCPGSACPVGW